MCGAYQLFTTSTPSFEQEGPTEPTEAPENLDENFVNNQTDDSGTQDNNTDSKIACYACHKHQNIKNGHRDENLDFKLKWRGKISSTGNSNFFTLWDNFVFSYKEYKYTDTELLSKEAVVF